jgi:uncharacterized protein YkwD
MQKSLFLIVLFVGLCFCTQTYEELAYDLFALHNSLRADSSSLITELENELAAGTNEESSSVYEETLAFLHTLEPLPALILDDSLTQACIDSCNYQGFSGQFTHNALDYDGIVTNMQTRITKYGEWLGCIGENISAGTYDAWEIMKMFILDANTPSKGHRNNIYTVKHQFELIGIACGCHNEWGIICSFDYACGFFANGAAPQPLLHISGGGYTTDCPDPRTISYNYEL